MCWCNVEEDGGVDAERSLSARTANSSSGKSSCNVKKARVVGSTESRMCRRNKSLSNEELVS